MNIKSRVEKLEATNRDGGMIFISTKGAAEGSEAKEKAGTTERTKIDGKQTLIFWLTEEDERL